MPSGSPPWICENEHNSVSKHDPDRMQIGHGFLSLTPTLSQASVSPAIGSGLDLCSVPYLFPFQVWQETYTITGHHFTCHWFRAWPLLSAIPFSFSSLAGNLHYHRLVFHLPLVLGLTFAQCRFSFSSLAGNLHYHRPSFHLPLVLGLTFAQCCTFFFFKSGRTFTLSWVVFVHQIMIGKRLHTLVLSAVALFCWPRNLHTCYTYLSFKKNLCVYLIFRRRWPKRTDIFTAHILNTKNPRHVQNKKNRMVMTTQCIESWPKHMGNKRKKICRIQSLRKNTYRKKHTLLFP